MFKALTAIITTLATATPLFAVPPTMSPKAAVSGTVVDYEKASGIVVLKDAKGVDTKLKEALIFVERPRTQRWLKSLDKGLVVVEIKKEDMKSIRKRQKISILDYQYGVDFNFVIVDYKKIQTE